jgi:hypothetical protein
MNSYGMIALLPAGLPTGKADGRVTWSRGSGPRCVRR